MSQAQTGYANVRVAYVLPWVSRNAGGLFLSVSGLAKAAGRLDGVEIRVFGVQDKFSEQDKCQWEPLVVETAGVIGPARLAYAPAMGRMIQRFSPDLIHSAAVWTHQAAVVNRLHSRAGVPFVLSPRGTLDAWALRRSRLKKAVARWLYQQRHFERAACIHALNESELNSIRTYGLRNPVCIIPNGVELPELEGPTMEERASSPGTGPIMAAGRKVLLYLGRIHPKKGLVNLLCAWAEMQKRRCKGAADWLLVIAGWEEVGHRGELLVLCDQLGLPVCRDFGDSSEPATNGPARDHAAAWNGGAHVVFLGPQFGRAKDACYRMCDAFILPSFSEGLPMAVLEAWSYAKPVLMTPQCNIPQGFDAQAAIRIEPTAESIAEGLRELFGAPESSLRTMGANGRNLVIKQFTWPTIAQQMKAVYDWVLGGGSPPATVHM